MLLHHSLRCHEHSDFCVGFTLQLYHHTTSWLCWGFYARVLSFSAAVYHQFVGGVDGAEDVLRRPCVLSDFVLQLMKPAVCLLMLQT